MKFSKLKQHGYFKILTFALIFILLVICIIQYRAKETYEIYISNKLSTDFQAFVTTIQHNNTQYNEVLSTGKFTKLQQDELMWNSEKIRTLILEYRALAVSLNLRKEEFSKNQSSLSQMKLSLLFRDWHETYNENLDENTKRILDKVRELNIGWEQKINKEAGYSLTNSSWVKLIEEIEQETLDFLNKYNIGNIEDMWLTRSEIK